MVFYNGCVIHFTCRGLNVLVTGVYSLEVSYHRRIDMTVNVSQHVRLKSANVQPTKSRGWTFGFSQ